MWLHSRSLFKQIDALGRICGLFGGDFNLAVWRITSKSPNLSRTILKGVF